MTNKTRILHLMNGFGNASIGQIVRQLIRILVQQDYEWHVGGLENRGELQNEFRHSGAIVVDFSAPQYKNSAWLIRKYIYENRIEIIHYQTPKSLLVAEIARLGLKNAQKGKVFHIATKNILNNPRIDAGE